MIAPATPSAAPPPARMAVQRAAFIFVVGDTLSTCAGAARNTVLGGGGGSLRDTSLAAVGDGCAGIGRSCTMSRCERAFGPSAIVVEYDSKPSARTVTE